ncbi:MAG: 4-(cytidine 5'-diphospho)-2-C-methyl-D-erythritol kinase [Ignavibacteria bacterium]|nr:4-(cytidine 5'-diphospho)-2-C-methyl-D-erythritol kinase [Ignavibacteria bacterium]
MKLRVSKYNVRSRAKINIGLRVLTKRADGYHNIETIFYPVKLYDNVQVKIERLPENAGENEINVKTTGKLKISGKNNICYKAVELFLITFKIEGKFRISISIKKQIPIGAGLGGGSGNASAVLQILMKHFSKEIKGISKRKQESILAKIALQLGSDVPYFLSGNVAAYGSGRGEKLRQIPKFKIRGKILIVNPGIHVSTTTAYKDLKVVRSKSKMLNKITAFDPADERLMINDFERVVFKKYPAIEDVKYSMMKMKAEFALMSGSGSTVYGVFKPIDFSKASRFFKQNKYKVFAG